MLIVNYWAIFGIAAINFIVGWVWYSVLFQKSWSKLTGMDKMSHHEKETMKKKAGLMFLTSFVSIIIMVYIFANFLAQLGIKNWTDGALWGFAAWFGFSATTSINDVLFNKKPVAQWLIETTYLLVTFVLSGILLELWG